MFPCIESSRYSIRVDYNHRIHAHKPSGQNEFITHPIASPSLAITPYAYSHQLLRHMFTALGPHRLVDGRTQQLQQLTPPTSSV